jgi:hypothetical protein
VTDALLIYGQISGTFWTHHICSPIMQFSQPPLPALHTILPHTGAITVENQLNFWSCYNICIQNLSPINLLYHLDGLPHKK